MLSDGLSSVVLVIEKGFDNLTNGGTSLDTNSSACCGFKIDFFTKKYFSKIAFNHGQVHNVADLASKNSKVIKDQNLGGSFQ